MLQVLGIRIRRSLLTRAAGGTQWGLAPVTAASGSVGINSVSPQPLHLRDLMSSPPHTHTLQNIPFLPEYSLQGCWTPAWPAGASTFLLIALGLDTTWLPKSDLSCRDRMLGQTLLLGTEKYLVRNILEGPERPRLWCLMSEV